MKQFGKMGQAENKYVQFRSRRLVVAFLLQPFVDLRLLHSLAHQVLQNLT